MGYPVAGFFHGESEMSSTAYKRQNARRLCALFLRQGGDDYVNRENEAVEAVQSAYSGVRVRVCNPAVHAGNLVDADMIVHDDTEVEKGLRCRGGEVVELAEVLAQHKKYRAAVERDRAERQKAAEAAKKREAAEIKRRSEAAKKAAATRAKKG